MMTREELEQIPAGTELLRAVRHMRDDEFSDLTTEEITNAARWLRAAAYSANEGARRMDAALTRRTTEQDRTCTSDPTTTASSTTTDAPPPAAPPAKVRRSPSPPKTKEEE